MPSKSVITIAMTDGAHAGEIARAAAERLGYRYVNTQIIDFAAEQAGVDPKTIAAVEHTKPLIARIMQSLAISSPDAQLTNNWAPLLDERPEYTALIKDVVRAVANEGKVVIGAHGASISLAGMPGLLRVFITASHDARVTRVASEQRVSLGDARKQVQNSDRERKAYFERFFNLGAEHPTHYDLVINTELLPMEAAVKVIAAAAE
jgi:cytidylate kinase